MLVFEILKIWIFNCRLHFLYEDKNLEDYEER